MSSIRIQLSRADVYRRYVLAVLTLVYTLNLLDRGLMSLLLQPIKEDLGLTDSQLGLLTGVAFGIFYATLGLPIARWADRGNRVTIASAAIGLWGLTVMACLSVTGFAQMMLARIAAAVGESGCQPPTFSLVGDYFPRSAQRSRAMAIYWVATPLAALISFIAGGWLNQRYGWRFTFFIMGVPALLVAVLVKLTVAEPRASAPEAARATPRPNIMVVLKVLWQQRAARHLIIAIVLLWTSWIGLGTWEAAFMMRSHGMDTAQAGLGFGLIYGAGGAVGILLGGFVAARWYDDDESQQLRLSATLITAQVPCYALFLLLASKWHALAALAPVVVMGNFFFGPTFALLQRLVADDMRATTLAVVMLFANLIGMGAGPQLVGILSDSLLPMLGSNSLKYAMLITSLIALWAAWHFRLAARTVKSDLAAVTR